MIQNTAEISERTIKMNYNLVLLGDAVLVATEGAAQHIVGVQAGERPGTAAGLVVAVDLRD